MASWLTTVTVAEFESDPVDAVTTELPLATPVTTPPGTTVTAARLPEDQLAALERFSVALSE